MQSNVSILFRPDYSTEEEFKVCKEFLTLKTKRSDIEKDTLVFGRYSVLPFYKELEEDLESNSSRLINSYEQHKYIADFEYYHDIKDYTFPTIFNPTDLVEEKYVVKGVTNSRKHEWNTMMYAPNRRRALEIYCDLKNDSLIRFQDIIFRKYVPLLTIDVGINDLPITNEWRLFYYKEDIIDAGFYWSCVDESIVFSLAPDFYRRGVPFANEVAKIISKKVNFFVIDIAVTADDRWVVVECNDAQMSGLNTISPQSFYCNLRSLIDDITNV